MALVSLLAFLPTLLLSVPAGVLADGYWVRWILVEKQEAGNLINRTHSTE